MCKLMGFNHYNKTLLDQNRFKSGEQETLKTELYNNSY